MPTINEHLAQARGNEDFADRLIETWGDTHAAWALTVLFYSAVHYGRAFVRARQGPTITSHPGFETYFLRTGGTSQHYAFYRRLKDESEHARYDCVSFTAQDVSDMKVRCLIPLRDALLPAIMTPSARS